MKKKALLIIAHGSRRERSNEEVKLLANKVSSLGNTNFDIVHAAFLEIAQPSIPQGLQNCVDQGASEIIVFPYFLSAGRHVAEDIPAEVSQYQAENAHIDIKITDYLGCLSTMPQLILNMVESATE